MSELSIWSQRERREAAAMQGLSRTSGPSARFADDRELLSRAWHYQPKDPTLLLGHHAGQLIGLANDDRHALTVAGTRGGKGISLVIPNLVLWPGSAFVLDPKGELARKTSRARRRLHGQKVVVLDPFGVSGQPQASCNLLDAIDLKSPFAVADLQLLLEAMIVTSAEMSDGGHFSNAAKALVLSLIVYAKVHFHRPSLVTVFHLLNGNYGSVLGSLKAPSDVFAVMLNTPDLNGTLRAQAIRWLEIPEKEQGSILSTARNALSWLEDLGNEESAMTQVSAPSSFSLADLKRENVTVYLCLPASYMHVYRTWLRTFVNMTMVALELTPSRPGTPPVLMVLDEFTSLGYMPSLETAAGLLAGAGVKMWPIIQNLSQLQKTYSTGWDTFLSNAGVTTWHAIGTDEVTKEYLSKQMGVGEYYEKEQSGGSFTQRASAGFLQGGGKWVSAPLMYPHEIGRAFARESGLLLALAPGQPPAILHRNNILDGFLGEWIDG